MQYNRLLVFACANKEIADIYIYMCMEILRYCMQYNRLLVFACANQEIADIYIYISLGKL